MKPFLLETNVLIALFWPAHDHHEDAQAWVLAHSGVRWAICPLTQSGFIRIASNPKFSRDAIPPGEAARTLSVSLARPGHRFLPAALSFDEAIAPFSERLRTHQQVTDAYLLGLAIHHRAKLATFDRGIESLAPDGSLERNALEIIQPRKARRSQSSG